MSDLTRPASARLLGAVVVRVLLVIGVMLMLFVLVEAWRPDVVLWFLELST